MCLSLVLFWLYSSMVVVIGGYSIVMVGGGGKAVGNGNREGDRGRGIPDGYFL